MMECGADSVWLGVWSVRFSGGRRTEDGGTGLWLEWLGNIPCTRSYLLALLICAFSIVLVLGKQMAEYARYTPRLCYCGHLHITTNEISGGGRFV